MKKAKPIIWGLTIIAFGVLFGGHALGLFNFDIFFEGWWTLFIIVPSAISLITEKERLTSLAFLSAGVLLLLAAQNVFSYDVAWKAILAVSLILIGISIIFRSTFHSKNDKEVEKKVKDLKDDGKMEAQVAVFSGSDRAYKKEVFSGANLTAFFGGVELDLRDAVFNKDTVIKAFCMFGGIEVMVPKDVNVKVRSGFAFGGVSDDRKDIPEKAKYTIYIDAGGGFGGITISDKDGKK